MTTSYPTEAEPQTLSQPILTQGLYGIFGACGAKPAPWAKQRRNQALIDAYKCDG